MTKYDVNWTDDQVEVDFEYQKEIEARLSGTQTPADREIIQDEALAKVRHYHRTRCRGRRLPHSYVIAITDSARSDYFKKHPHYKLVADQTYFDTLTASRNEPEGSEDTPKPIDLVAIFRSLQEWVRPPRAREKPTNSPYWRLRTAANYRNVRIYVLFKRYKDVQLTAKHLAMRLTALHVGNDIWTAKRIRSQASKGKKVALILADAVLGLRRKKS
jgi:hypothetical protein